MSDSEGKVLAMYEGARPREEDLFETSNVNHIAWSLVVILLGLVIWLCITLVNAENQRHALITNQCPDPVFKSGVDKACLYTVKSRAHWWEHLWYGFTHVKPERK
ncbi:hypothetical protein [Massilia brevitalea]|uniref:hypothetical protein n=1 Tax=Massilia brevitalea TaxID=442526 RepID=UPI002738BB57|nr:hypothetical protein [Massilia brevitalea]